MLAQGVTWAKLQLCVHFGLTCWKIAIRVAQFFKTSMSLDDLATFFLQNNNKKKLAVIFKSVVYPKKKKKKKKKKTGWKSSLVRICQGVYCTHFLVKFLLLIQSN